jgi:hypothetical protein
MWAVAVALSCGGGLAAVAADAVPPEQVEFFEARIRPVLVESCYPCHSAAAGKSKGGLTLDTGAGVLRGGDSGPALVAGKPDESLLVRAVRYTDPELQMPPKSAGGRLPDEVVADLEAWVSAGAPDPRSGVDGKAPLPGQAAARTHWAFQPVVAPPLPGVRNTRWVQTPVDAFVLAKLEARGWSPAPAADRRTLLRRLAYDLTGLPPSFAEVETFQRDRSPDAVATQVERLLASPHYGERWARHWLDVARYADTKGYVFQEERRYAFSHTYRDYVIRAFNDDKPYDQFLVEQIAADHLVTGEDRSALAALGFLTLGRRFLNNPDDIIDDRIDVVCRGTMALTVGCARCHDHKFDPIPIQDYYGLHGVFASSEEPAEKPLLGPLRETRAYAEYLAARAGIEAEVAEVRRREVAKYLGDERGRVADYLLAAQAAWALPAGTSLASFAGERKVVPVFLDRWLAFLKARQAAGDPVLRPWFALAALSEGQFVEQASAVLGALTQGIAGEITPSPRVLRVLAEARPGSLKEAAAAYGRVFAEVDRAWQDAVEAARKAGTPAPAGLGDPEAEMLRQVLYADGAPSNLPTGEAQGQIQRRIDNLTVGHRQRIEALNWSHAGAPARAMALRDRPHPHNSRVYIRGNPANRGPEAPRQFLELLAGASRAAFTNGSGRLELARAIAARENPLTARVFVNRAWGWHFGVPLVRTPSDFGVRTEAPVQLDLLNWLAASFVNCGWSTKHLHRQIVLSSTYQQAASPDAQTAAADPDNQFLHRVNRRRLEFEALRDTLLVVSGKLDATVGGLPVDLWAAPFSQRRSVYGFIDRQNLPGVFRTFDYPNPDTSSAGRFATTVPQQSLFLLNHPFVIEQARGLLARTDVLTAATDEERVAVLYRTVFERLPEPGDLELARAFLDSASAATTCGSAPGPASAQPTTLSRWEQYTQVLLLSNEVMFLD